MWKWSGILFAGAVLTGSPVKGQDPVLSLALARVDGPGEMIGMVPRAPASPAVAPQNRIDGSPERLSIAPPAELTFNSPLELFGSVTRYGSLLDPYVCDLRSIAPSRYSDTVDQLRAAMTLSDDPFAPLGNIFDVQDMERPWSTTTSIRLQAKTDEGLNRWVPFATVAREVAAVEDRERLGMGGGAAYRLTSNTALVTELLYFGDRMNSGNAWDRETRFTVGFQFSF